MKRMLSRLVVLIVGLSHVTTLAPAPRANAGAPKASKPFKHVQAFGDVAVDKDVLSVKAASVTVVIGENEGFYRATAELQFAPKASANYVQVMPADPLDFKRPAALHAYITRDAPGILLQMGTYTFDDKTKQWAGNKDVAYNTYWPAPTDKGRLALLADSKLTPRTWKDRWLRVRVEADRRRVALWFDGRLLSEVERPAGAKGPVAIQLQQGDRLRNVSVTPLAPDATFLPIDLTAETTDRFIKKGDGLGNPSYKTVGKTSQMNGVPFELAEGEQAHLSLRQAQWIEHKTDPADYYEWYDFGPPILHDPRMPFLRVPLADYTAAHLLAVADDDAGLTNNLTLRAGRYGWNEQVALHEYPGSVPRRGEAKKIAATQVLDTPAGPLFHVRVPMTQAIAQDLSNFLEIELTKEIRLARRQPDPNRFRLRPLGLPSGVRIAALTLERSPLQMRVTSKESGHAFVEPQKPAFHVRLHNITAAEQTYKLTLSATHLDGAKTETEQTGRVPPGQIAEPVIPLPAAKRGYHDLAVTLKDGSGRVLLERRTSFALLAPDTRKHRDKSPFGTWDFCGGHYTSDDPDQTGPLYVKLGLRYGMGGNKPEARKKYGILPGNEPVVLTDAKPWEAHLKSHPDTPPIGLLFHEHGVSGKHLTRVPDLFHDRPAYQFDEAEKKQFQKMWDEATGGAKAMRSKYPKVHLRFGNGALPTQEEFLRKKFPAELFDSLGNECPSFGRHPEAQPPDCVAFNSSLWMDRQMLDAYGYKDKPVSVCYELLYPCSNPGNLSLGDQADYFVRHALHGLAWGLPEIKLGCISDMGNSYYYSNWGATGFCRSKPELSVKPAFVAMATLTRVLDGAKFVRILPLDSPSVHGMEFLKPDGARVFAFWTVQGKRDVSFRSAGAWDWTRIDDQGQETPLAIKAGGGINLGPISSKPVYLVGKAGLKGEAPKELIDVTVGPPVYVDKPAGKSAVLHALTNLDDWTVEADRNVELEYYNFMCPRRKGDFEFTPAANLKDIGTALKVAPRPIKHGKDTMPMYAVLAHKKGIPVPGKPTEVGVWVNGNSGWGRLIFELQDASGQRWISIGAQQTDIPNKWIEDIVPKELMPKFAKPGISDWNTEDVFGLSRINFDGWRYLAFPLPGNYPGESYGWPANSQWRGDKDGIVHYPLTFKKLIIELPEKVLHVKTYAPPPRAEIYLKELTVGQAD